MNLGVVDNNAKCTEGVVKKLLIHILAAPREKHKIANNKDVSKTTTMNIIHGKTRCDLHRSKEKV